ncbi:hypothetical protein ZWY2020_034168 [Hordeum vulgare]|nr:hypothetical protein ZWY2020_034168 [Hordeum vulgare]
MEGVTNSNPGGGIAEVIMAVLVCAVGRWTGKDRPPRGPKPDWCRTNGCGRRLSALQLVHLLDGCGVAAIRGGDRSTSSKVQRAPASPEGFVIGDEFTNV